MGAAIAALTLTLALPSPSGAQEAPVLRDLGAARGVFAGTAVTSGKLGGGYATVAGTQFGSVTPGNEMKWASVEPQRGTFQWGGADTVVKLERQKADYRSVTAACVAVTRCRGLTAWGFTDSDSWIADFFPGQGAATPYDGDLRPKPAYYGIAEALGWAAPAGSCAVTYRVDSQWDTGFAASVTVRNTGSTPIDGWRLAWSFPDGRRVSQSWNATVTQTGAAAAAVNASHNAAVPPGGSVSFGFPGTRSPQETATPDGFVLNGEEGWTAWATGLRSGRPGVR
ncbi:cellulose binding domain-containing protein [Streptomyces sp. ISL-43]|nr:cellulose binding domain-containing protein [Streptomyces sp. ISL-43]